MGANFLILFLSAAVLQTPPPDTASPDSNPAIEQLIERTVAEGPADSLDEEPNRGIAYERLTDALRYDRVQGLSLGLGYRVRLAAADFAGLYGTVRYGLSDDRLTGRLTFLHNAPGGRLALSAYREVWDVDPFASGHGVGNTLNALFAGHDNSDYALVHGGSAGYETPLRAGLDLGLGVRLELERSVGREARSALNDFLGGTGLFPANPAVSEGTFGGVWARLDGFGRRRWTLTADLLAGEGSSTGRLYGRLRENLGGRRGVTVELKAGIATRPTLPQSLFRLGGVATVRGFEYGELRGQAFWAARLDIAPFRSRVRPVIFGDAGQAANAEDLFSSKALVGAGVGLSLFNGILRFDLSHPISPDLGGKVRFDIIVQAAK